VPVLREGAARRGGRPHEVRGRNRNGLKGSCAEILVGGVGGARLGPVVVIGLRHVDDDSGFFFGRSGFEGDGAVGVEELVGDVGEDGGAARGDAAFGD